MSSIKLRAARFLDGVDRVQRRHRLLGFPLAVRKKYSDDQGGNLAAMIAYYGFFSLFPLLLVFVTALGYILPGHVALQQRIFNSALGQFPVIGAELRGHALHGNGLALGLGIVASLWTGIGVLLAAENAMSQLWGVPKDKRLGFVASRLRALGLLVVLGGGVVATTVVSGFGTSGAGRAGVVLRVLAIAGALVVDFFLFWLAFRLLTPEGIGWGCLRGGAAAAAVGYELLQLVGSYYVTHTLKGASNVYGTFGLVIGLLTWIYLTATVILLAAEGSVVANRRLWPRPLRTAPGEQGRSGEAGSGAEPKAALPVPAPGSAAPTAAP